MEVVEFEVAKKLLVENGIPFPRTVFVSSEKELLKDIKNFKFPVFLKIYGKDVLHRMEIGGVGEASNRAELKKMFLKMIKIKGAEGVLIQEKVIGKSLIIGMKRDLQFGPVIMVGIGGTFTEIIKDFVLRVAPVSEKEALKMLVELKWYAYLCGKRDKEPVNFKEIAKIIVSLSKLSLKRPEGYPEIKEIDLNPVIANGKIASAVDFKFLI